MARVIDPLPIDPQDRHTGAVVDGAWVRVADATREPFTGGMTAATMAGMAWGARRAGEDIIATMPTAEAVWAEALAEPGFAERLSAAIKRMDGSTAEAIDVYRPPAGPPADPSAFPIDPATGYPDLRGTPFGLDNPRAVQGARDHAAELVRNVDDETRARLRHLVTDARINGQSGDVLARRIRGEFPRMASPVAATRGIRDRAHLIAVTETSFAYEAGQRAAADRSKAAGLEMVKSWLTVGDERVCAICNGNEGADEIADDAAFPSGHEGPPGHPGCRCTSQWRALTSAERGIDLFGPGGPFAPPVVPPAPPPSVRPRRPRAAPPTPAPSAPETSITGDRMRERMERAFPGVRTEGLDSMAPTLRAEVADALERMAARFPDVRPASVMALTPAEAVRAGARGLRARQAMVVNGRHLVFNRAHWSKEQTIRAADDALRAAGDHSAYASVAESMTGVEYTIAHEFGHLVDAQRFGNLASGARQVAASRYAGKDFAERWAEGFAQWVAGLGTPAARYVADRLREYAERGF